MGTQRYVWAREKTCPVFKANGFSAEEAEGADCATKDTDKDKGKEGGLECWINWIGYCWIWAAIKGLRTGVYRVVTWQILVISKALLESRG